MSGRFTPGPSTERAAARCGLIALIVSIAIIATTVMEVVLLAALFGRTSSSDLAPLVQLVLLAVLAAPGIVLLQSSLALRGQAGDRRRLVAGINKLRTYFVIVAVLAGLLLLRTAASLALTAVLR